MSDESYWARVQRQEVGRRRVLGGMAAGSAALVLSLAGCGGGRKTTPATNGAANATGKPRTGGKASVRTTADPFDWDMSYAGKSVPNDYGSALAYDSLLGFRHGADVKFTDAILTPELALKWEVPDATTYTFQLRPGVTFANQPPLNGRALVSGDVKWSYEYWSRSGEFKDKKLPAAQYASYFEGIDHIETPDAATVMVKFKAPFVPFLNYTGSYFNPIVPHDIYDQDGTLHNRIVGTGPFQLDEAASQKGSRWIWKRNPTYWDAGKPYLDEVDWIVLTDEGAADTAFQTKQVDVIGVANDTITYVSAQQLKKANPSATVYEYLPVGTTLYLNLNTRVMPLKETRLRQAMSLAIDRDEFIKTFSGGQGGWALVGAFPDTFTQEEIHQILKYDPAQAKQLLAAAGMGDGVEMEYIYPGNAYGQDYVSQIQLLQAQLRKVGINLTLKSQDKNAWTNNRKSYTFTMTGSGKADLIGDVDSWLYDFHSGNRSNYSGVNDPKLDALIDGQRREPDAAKRKDLVRQAVRLANEQAYALAIFTGAQYQFVQPRLKDYWPNFGCNTVPQVDSWVQA